MIGSKHKIIRPTGVDKTQKFVEPIIQMSATCENEDKQMSIFPIIGGLIENEYAIDTAVEIQAGRYCLYLMIHLKIIGSGLAFFML